jgi:hypothetical protein
MDEVLAYNNIMYAFMFLIFFVGITCGLVLAKIMWERVHN